MQLQQRHSTTDFLGLAQSCVPIQPSADHPRQNPSGNSGLFIQGLLNAFENIWAKFLTADRHTGSLEDQYSLCPAKNVGHVQSFRKGRMSRGLISTACGQGRYWQTSVSPLSPSHLQHGLWQTCTLKRKFRGGVFDLPEVVRCEFYIGSPNVLF